MKKSAEPIIVVGNLSTEQFYALIVQLGYRHHKQVKLISRDAKQFFEPDLSNTLDLVEEQYMARHGMTVKEFETASGFSQASLSRVNACFMIKVIRQLFGEHLAMQLGAHAIRYFVIDEEEAIERLNQNDEYFEWFMTQIKPATVWISTPTRFILYKKWLGMREHALGLTIARASGFREE